MNNVETLIDFQSKLKEHLEWVLKQNSDYHYDDLQDLFLNLTSTIEEDLAAENYDYWGIVNLSQALLGAVCYFYAQNLPNAFLSPEMEPILCKIPQEYRMTAGEVFDALSTSPILTQKKLLGTINCNIGVLEVLMESLQEHKKELFVDNIIAHNVDMDALAKIMNFIHIPSSVLSDEQQFNLWQEIFNGNFAELMQYAKMIYENTSSNIGDKASEIYQKYFQTPHPFFSWINNTNISCNDIMSILSKPNQDTEAFEELIQSTDVPDKDKYVACYARWKENAKMVYYQLITKNRPKSEHQLLSPILSSHYFCNSFAEIQQKINDVIAEEKQFANKILTDISNSFRQDCECCPSQVVVSSHIQSLSAQPVKKVILLKLTRRLAGVFNEDNDKTFETEHPYILAKDIPAFYYFLTGDSIDGFIPSNQSRIQWLGNWQSLKYLLYGIFKPSPLPDGINEAISSSFMFNANKTVTAKTFGGSNLNKLQGDMTKRHKAGQTEEVEFTRLDKILSCIPKALTISSDKKQLT